MKWRTLVLVAVVGLLMMAILPAQADHVEAVRVNGNSTCLSVGSTGDFSFKIAPVTFGPHTDPATGAIFHISEPKFAEPNTFTFSVEDGVVHDALVKGSAANHYDYAGDESGPVTFDNNLTIPNGNSLKHVIFCYDLALAEAQPMVCGIPATTSDGETSASFTREPTGDCEGEKNAVLDIQGETIVFIPEGVGSANYTGDLSFIKQFDDPELLVLLYDPDDAGPLGFRPVPACQDDSLTVESIPSANGDTWCFYHVDADPADGGVEVSAFAVGDWEVNWSVFGMGDPRFK
jgi:hypothetical protein